MMASSMPTLSATCKLTSRMAYRQLRRPLTSRNFSRSTQPMVAKNFTMPAMSPTMTEGNISSWKVKEGDSFAAGDVLLEIETDKAQMDVEAQEDGKVAKILLQDGSKAVKVGARIGVLAELEDDLSSLEIPKEEAMTRAMSEPKSQEPENSPSEIEATPQTTPKTSESITDSSSTKHLPQKYPLYPSVEHLLHINGLSTTDASKIPATGPLGRLLKGDVLAYLGQIEKSYPSNQSKRISSLAHLDLDNIKIAPLPAKKESAEPPAASPAEDMDLNAQVALPVSLTAVMATQKRLQDALGIFMPLSTFIARASDLANEDLPRPNSQPTADELFYSILGSDGGGAGQKTSRGNYLPLLTSLPPVADTIQVSKPRKPVDIIDMLSNPPPLAVKSPTAHTPKLSSGVSNIFSVVVPKRDKARAKVYLERMKTMIEQETGRLVL